MVRVFAVFMWVTPALIAGILGWKSIWGTDSALLDYLIPFPLTGGIFHVPSFAIACAGMVVCKKASREIRPFFGLAAFIIFILVLSYQIEFERLYAWATTDYEPYGSPLRFDSNAVYLFVTTDAFFFWLYVVFLGGNLKRYLIYYLAVFVLIPPVYLALKTVNTKVGKAEFKMGGISNTKQRGQEIRLIYTNAKPSENEYLAFIDEHRYSMQPWTSPNAEHLAIYFTNSRQLLEWRKFDELNEENTLATVCRYEEDQSTRFYLGKIDCFEGLKTVATRLKERTQEINTGLGPSVDLWMARADLCEDIVVPEDPAKLDIEIYSLCWGLKTYFEKDLANYIKSYGEGSKEVAAILERAIALEIIPEDYNLQAQTQDKEAALD